MFKIGNVVIKNKVILAPMAGISNPAYIRICEEFGVAYAITELISAEAIVRNNKKTFEMLNGFSKIKIPVAIQLFGSKADTISLAAKIIEQKFKPAIIDINMGCPVPKVALRSEAGSGLLKNVDKVFEIVSKTVESVNIPVTVKIRSGWDKNSINAVLIAKTVEKAGAKAITVHGRTRADGYTGKVDLDIIKKVKENVSIPVIGNGDIKSYLDALNMINYTKCDAVMIGRGCLGNPWLIKECVDYLEDQTLPEPVTDDMRIAMIIKHLDYLMEDKPYKLAMLEIRTHAAWYLKGLKNSKEIKQAIFKSQTREELLNILNRYEG